MTKQKASHIRLVKGEGLNEVDVNQSQSNQAPSQSRLKKFGKALRETIMPKTVGDEGAILSIEASIRANASEAVATKDLGVTFNIFGNEITGVEDEKGNRQSLLALLINDLSVSAFIVHKHTDDQGEVLDGVSLHSLPYGKNKFDEIHGGYGKAELIDEVAVGSIKPTIGMVGEYNIHFDNDQVHVFDEAGWGTVVINSSVMDRLVDPRADNTPAQKLYADLVADPSQWSA